MSGNHRSSGAFCSVVVSATTGTFDSVAALDTAAFGDGAEVFCAANRGVYRLNFASVQATVGSVFIKPNSGSGCWFLQDAQSNYANSVQGTSAFTGSSAGGGTVNVWFSFPSSAGFYAATPLSSSFWALNTTSGILTYSGPSGLLFQIIATLSISPQNDDDEIELDLTTNGALVGTSTTTQSAAITRVPVDAGGATPIQIVHQNIFTLTNSSTAQHVLRSTTVGPGLTLFYRYQVSITQL